MIDSRAAERERYTATSIPVKLAQQYPGPFLVSLAATIASVALAVLPNWSGTYDATLAVLAATLIAIIWYTFFTYCALHRTSPAALTFRVDHAQARMIILRIENNSVERSVTAKWRASGRRDNQELAIPDSLRNGEPFSLRPGEVREANFQLAAAKPAPGSDYGPAIQLGEPPEAIFRIDIAWEDDCRNRGSVGPDYYAIDVLSLSIRRYQVVTEAISRWRALGGPELAPLAV